MNKAIFRLAVLLCAVATIPTVPAQSPAAIIPKAAAQASAPVTLKTVAQSPATTPDAAQSSATGAPNGSAQTSSPTAPNVHGQTPPAQPILKGFPFTNESLAYTATWPSGISLGEAHLSATRTTAAWQFELSLDAGIPGFTVKDRFHSTATPNLCSETFSKDISHGNRKGNETVVIDPATAIATRSTVNSDGVSKMPVPDCVRDALTFLYYARQEMGQGHVPTAQEIIFGAIYDGSFEYTGAETIIVNNKRTLTDKVVCHIKGPASDTQFEVYFDRDAARTPLSIRVPLPLGKFSLELVR